jgi:hypothetical protein
MKLVKETKRLSIGEVTREEIPGKVWKNKRFYLNRREYIDLETKQYYVSRPLYSKSSLFKQSEWVPINFPLNEWIRIYGTDILERYSIEEEQDLKDEKRKEEKMTKLQKFIIIIYLIIVAVACIYVPWETRLPSPNSNVSESLGYSPIWSPLPMIYGDKTIPNLSIVDIKRVILELIAITAIFGVLFVCFSFKRD